MRPTRRSRPCWGRPPWYELKGTGVDVLVVIAGLMNTQGDAFAKFPRLLVAEPELVAREVLSPVGRKHMVIPGYINRAFVLAQTRLSSRRRTITSIGKFLEKGLEKSSSPAATSSRLRGESRRG